MVDQLTSSLLRVKRGNQCPRVAIDREVRQSFPQRGVQICGVGNRTTVNHISDAPHSVINFTAFNQLISQNEIFDVFKESKDVREIYIGLDKPGAPKCNIGRLNQLTGNAAVRISKEAESGINIYRSVIPKLDPFK